MNTLTIERKTCAICGQDCSNQARFKDGFDQYYHQSCHEQSKKAELALAKPSLPKRRTCKSCNRAVAPGAHHCKDCEQNLRNRKRFPSKTRKPIETETDENPLSPAFMASLLIVPALSMIPLVGPILVAGSILLAVLHLVVEAFREHIAWGIMVALSSFLPILWMAFVVIHWDRAKRPFILLLVGTGTIVYQMANAG